MDFRHFPPLTSNSRQNHRAAEPPVQSANQYHLADSPYSGPFLDELAFHPRRGSLFGMGYNGAQDFHSPALRTRRLPFNAFPTEVLGRYPLRVRFMGDDPTGGTGRSPTTHMRETERFPNRDRLIDVPDEERPSRFGTEQRRRGSKYNIGLFSSLTLNDHECPKGQRRPEIGRSTLAPQRSPNQYRRRLQGRHFESMAGRMPTPGAYGEREQNPQPGAQNNSAVPFPKAMQWLHEGLADAEKFYKKFYEDYNKEIKSVKYAATDILQGLWVQKVAGRVAAGQSGSHDKRPAEKWEEKFAEKRRGLHEAMEAALSASLSLGDKEPPQNTTYEARKRLLEKVATAGHHVEDLLGLAMTGSEHCRALLDELKMLKDLVDPKKKENKSLYDGIDRVDATGDTGGAQDDGGYDEYDGGEYNNDSGPAWE